MTRRLVLHAETGSSNSPQLKIKMSQTPAGRFQKEILNIATGRHQHGVDDTLQ